MSNNKAINEIISLLEKTQKVSIWDSKNIIKADTTIELHRILDELKKKAIKDHILELFGPKEN